MAEKKGTHTLEEIIEQAAAWRATLGTFTANRTALEDFLNQADFAQVTAAGATVRVRYKLYDCSGHPCASTAAARRRSATLLKLGLCPKCCAHMSARSGRSARMNPVPTNTKPMHSASVPMN